MLDMYLDCLDSFTLVGVVSESLGFTVPLCVILVFVCSWLPICVVVFGCFRHYLGALVVVGFCCRCRVFVLRSLWDCFGVKLHWFAMR